jgi:hypothetical protein
MSKGSFEKDNLGWQLSQLRQRVGEWWELQTSGFSPHLPDASLPSWWDSPIIQAIVKAAIWMIVILLVIWVSWQMWRRLRPYIYSLTNPLNQSAKKATKTPLKELSIAGWLQRSQKFQQQGNYREACQCLYMAMLQRLNDSGIAPHEPSRTDGEYLKLVQQLPQPKPYQTLLMTHQRLSFSNAEASSSVFEQCQQAYREMNDE